jgi:multidrug efflux system membrane fusion protein
MPRNPSATPLPMPRGHSVRGRMTLLAVVAAASATLAACKNEQPSAEAPQPVRVMAVMSAQDVRATSYVGVVRARYESDLGFRVAGKITERLVNVGDAVTAGQVLARLDVTDLQLAREANEAEQAAARSNLDQATAAEVRARDLLARGHVAQAVYDQRRAALDEAKGRLERADRNLAISRNQADYASLKADHAGIVTQLPVEVGQVVAAGQLVVRLARDGAREAVVAIPESRIADIREARSEVELWASTARRYAASLREISPQADTATRTYQARFSILEADPGVALGMTATVMAHATQSVESVRVPASAVINDGRGAAVWVIDGSGQRVVRRPVTVKSFGQADVTLSAGLSQGERIVTLGVHVLDEGRPVRIVEQRQPVKLAADSGAAAQ